MKIIGRAGSVGYGNESFKVEMSRRGMDKLAAAAENARSPEPGDTMKLCDGVNHLRAVRDSANQLSTIAGGLEAMATILRMEVPGLEAAATAPSAEAKSQAT